MCPGHWPARLGAGGFLLLLSVLAGCASAPQSARLREQPPAGLTIPVELRDVPFYPQEAYQCGPAALATLLKHDGVPVTPSDLAPEVYLPERQGSLQVELLAAARRHGRVAYVLAPKLDHLLAEVRAGHPVLVLQNLALDWWPRWHYAVIVGYDLSRENVVLRSGSEERRVTPISVFERTWQRAGGWAMVTLTPERMPVTAEELPFLRAVAAHEELKQNGIARSGYAAATARWPESVTAWMALGNAEYASGSSSDAEAAFRRAAELDPRYAPAFNNLAHVLADQRRFDEALSSARQAHALGKGEPIYEATLREIADRRSKSK